MSKSWLRPFGTFDLVFWSVLLCVFAIALIRAFINDDGEKIFTAGLLTLTSLVWLARTLHARRARTRQADDVSLR